MEIIRYIVIFLIMFIVFIIGVAYEKGNDKRRYDGCLFIERKDDRDLYRWVFEKDLDEIVNMKDILIEVRNQASSFDLEGKKGARS